MCFDLQNSQLTGKYKVQTHSRGIGTILHYSPPVQAPMRISSQLFVNAILHNLFYLAAFAYTPSPESHVVADQPTPDHIQGMIRLADRNGMPWFIEEACGDLERSEIQAWFPETLEIIMYLFDWAKNPKPKFMDDDTITMYIGQDKQFIKGIVRSSLLHLSF